MKYDYVLVFIIILEIICITAYFLTEHIFSVMINLFLILSLLFCFLLVGTVIGLFFIDSD